MKNLNKISILLILLLGLTFTSCETTDLDLINDPNQITVDNGNLDRYMVATMYLSKLPLSTVI